jgi:CRISPR-associated protein Csy2
MSELPIIDGLLVLPHLRIQNANAISAPMTWGFPSMTAFLGLMWALERALDGRYPLVLNGVGVVCHAFDPQVNSGGFTRSFCLTRNPIEKDGRSASITEEGRTHLDVTVVFGVAGKLLASSQEEKEEAAKYIANQVAHMRIAGGTVLPAPFPRPPYLISLAGDEEKQTGQFHKLRTALLPGFSLVERNDLLEQRYQELVANTPEATRLDAWLDLARLNWSASSDTSEGDTEAVTWQHDRTNGWIVPIPLGYAALADVQEPGTVMNARDVKTPFRFVESVYGIGQWIGPHRLTDVRQMLWYATTDVTNGLYRCCNDYTQFR